MNDNLPPGLTGPRDPGYDCLACPGSDEWHDHDCPRPHCVRCGRRVDPKPSNGPLECLDCAIQDRYHG